ncbi:bifunctional demethylmenaquinone methyltransferase/2-methoxy-6-polyprenyl-1,4-benzoquinol methylase UbiE [Campylobacter sp. FMV-PI01]|uniref:Demethylmenaquinone methyltransferase n=1 Tax=Campylobacter portucalensis TaxID=2608384 RepID=A0A6L5WHI2_9BACT|nr:bifunctional demethylmenaquinone methyltransferase/2-methoxy-6-polyprenyl-1,4-benzoquinol methylase UbiE [Campylobacter portucalensis]MSN95667.1 bifunctional demethylmenaquinone methyltransferase/2-methoxy-6-polyprenyl-1,4-benzoquinol methylase UbiE [Campylobacter portucalensis]
MKQQEKIIEMFNAIAPTYDKANRFMSFGIDISWRKEACSNILGKFINKDMKIADVACGTGDMMGLWDNMSKGYNTNISKLVGVDPSSGMLEVAMHKFPNFEFIQASATHTTLKDREFDALSITFGIRNIIERLEALKEFNRVLKNGGYFVALEFTKPKECGIAGKCRDFYIKKILPKIGGYISKNKEAYEYLPQSIDNFLDVKEFENELLECGFRIELTKGFNFDVTTLFIAKKIRDI